MMLSVLQELTFWATCMYDFHGVEDKAEVLVSLLPLHNLDGTVVDRELATSLRRFLHHDLCFAEVDSKQDYWLSV